MRSYGQYCSVAKALDVIGDRWTLLVIRELLLQGPCRYTDLKNGLPGIATNLLSDRLRELEAVGLVRREEAAPPVATTLFHLTEAGASLEPALDALGAWGIRYMTQPADGDEFRSHWLTFPVSLFLHDSEPGRPGALDRAAPRRPPRCHRGVRRRGPHPARRGAVPRPGPGGIPAAHPRPARGLPHPGRGPRSRPDHHRRPRHPAPPPARPPLPSPQPQGLEGGPRCALWPRWRQLSHASVSLTRMAQSLVATM